VRLVLAGVVAAMALAVAAPAQAALPTAPTLPVQQTLDTASSTAASAAGSVQQQATKGIAAAKQVAPRVPPPPAAREITHPRIVPPRPPATPPAPAPRATLPAPTLPASPAEVVPTEEVGRATSEYRKKLVQPPVDVPRVGLVDDAVALLGNTLRKIAPVGTLLAPVKPLLGDLGELNGLDLHALVAVVSPGKAQTLSVSAERRSFAPPPSGAAPPAASAARAPSQTFKAASARPPAAEVGGRPVSPPPRTAPAPVAGGAAALFSGGIFVPFLALLVLAALAAPRLMRRLDELPAFVRPGPFLCALERPG
jgi:hypothetical protein